MGPQEPHGTFILRIEDTDKEREVPGSKQQIMDSLNWLGVVYDEGPDIGGPNAPYLQSERLPSYKEWGQKLVDAGFAYADTFTEAEVEAFRTREPKPTRKSFSFSQPPSGESSGLGRRHAASLQDTREGLRLA